jgi:hypothetical protein
MRIFSVFISLIASLAGKYHLYSHSLSILYYFGITTSPQNLFYLFTSGQFKVHEHKLHHFITLKEITSTELPDEMLLLQVPTLKLPQRVMHGGTPIIPATQKVRVGS